MQEFDAIRPYSDEETGAAINRLVNDREFLDNVVTDTVFLDGSGKVREFVGGYTDWRRQGGRFPAEAGARSPPNR